MGKNNKTRKAILICLHTHTLTSDTHKHINTQTHTSGSMDGRKNKNKKHPSYRDRAGKMRNRGKQREGEIGPFTMYTGSKKREKSKNMIRAAKLPSGYPSSSSLSPTIISSLRLISFCHTHPFCQWGDRQSPHKEHAWQGKSIHPALSFRDSYFFPYFFFRYLLTMLETDVVYFLKHER